VPTRRHAAIGKVPDSQRRTDRAWQHPAPMIDVVVFFFLLGVFARLVKSDLA